MPDNHGLCQACMACQFQEAQEFYAPYMPLYKEEKMYQRQRIMIIGFGSTAKYLVDYLIDNDIAEDHDIIIATRDVEGAQKHINLAKVSAGIRGKFPQFRVVPTDLMSITQTVETLRQWSPHYIVYTARWIKGTKYGQFSYPNDIGYGAWLPLAVPLVHRLMIAVRSSGINTKVINTSFPDGVNPLLASAHYDVWTGAGNLNHLIPRIKIAVARNELVPPDLVDVSLVGSHYLNTYVSKEGSAKGSPYHMEIYVDGERVRGMDEEIFSMCQLPMPSGEVRNRMIASDCAQILKLATCPEIEEVIHLPGALGLIGGYPCLFKDGELLVLNNLDIDFLDMIDINEGSLRCDGIDCIKDGEVYFTTDTTAKMFVNFNIKYPKKLQVSECINFADEIQAKIREYQEEEERENRAYE